MNGPHYWLIRQKQRVHQSKYPNITIPQKINDQCKHSQFGTDEPFGIILFFPDKHDSIHHKEEVGVQRTDVVEDVRITMCQTQEEDEEVESPQHLKDAREGVVIGSVEKGEVAEASHPYVACDHDLPQEKRVPRSV